MSSAAEKAIYDQHQNSPDDLQYRRFLSRLTEPLLERLGPCSRGLDFGCGPGPTLSVMMAEQGHD
ncbi:MAG: methyltransferase, partial [Porticoccaceae bacterium]